MSTACAIGGQCNKGVIDQYFEELEEPGDKPNSGLVNTHQLRKNLSAFA